MPFFKSSMNLKLKPNESTVLIEACRTKTVEVVKALIAHGANINQMGKYQETALTACIQAVDFFPVSEDEAILNALLEGGCDVDLGGDGA